MGAADPVPGGSELEELVAGVLARLDEDAQALERACRARPELAGELHKRVETLRELGLVARPGAKPHPDRLGEFELVERIGVGGMGVVYHAVQTSLGREVALKVIRPEMLHLPGARERFARETTIVARLQHPGIVPIYTVGAADELPYYAMERVPGCTLAEALQELGRGSTDGLAGADLARAVRARSRSSDGAGAAESALYSGSWEETALRIALAVADALEHAHGRGVLHRDVKPSNVMLTPGGRVMLVDFGLSQSEGVDALTRSGERAGSLPYMPPEALQSGLQAVDRRSDVYSLGVLLYQLLTLRLPFVEGSVPAQIASILEGRPRRPRAHAPRLSWEAETVTLVALERDPARRYATAADLARDLERALERRPVAARRASAWLRARRWAQRHPGAAVALLLAALLPTVVAALQVREARRIRRSLDLAEEQRTLAEASFQRAMRAIESMLNHVGSVALDDVPGLDSIRAELLGEAHALYAEAESERPDDPQLTALAANAALAQVGVLRRQDRLAEAEPIVRRTLARLDARPEPPSRPLRHLHARALALLADVAREREQEAELQRRAHGELEALVAEAPDDVEACRDLVELEASMVVGARARGERASAPVDLGRAESLARRVLARDPSEASEGLLARVRSLQGFWAASEGRLADAVAPYEEALEVRRRALAAHPDDDDARAALIEIASNLGSIYGVLQRLDDSLALLVLAADESRRNLADYPDVPKYRVALVDAEINLAATFGRMRRADEQRAALERAVELQRGLLELRNDVADDQRVMATILLNLAGMQSANGELETALSSCEVVRATLERAVEMAPEDPDIGSWLALERNTCAGALIRLERIAEAAETLAETPKLALHRADRAAVCLKRVVQCLELAKQGGEPETLRRVLAAARTAERLAAERGDLERDPSLARVRALLAED